MTKRWKVTRLAAIIGICMALIQVLRSADVAWAGEKQIDAPIGILVLGELLAALSVGVTVDLLRPLVRNRWQAALVGMVAWFPVMLLIYFLLVPISLSPLEVLRLSAIGSLLIGGTGGFVLYESSD